jgi:hypothetical protein
MDVWHDVTCPAVLITGLIVMVRVAGRLCMRLEALTAAVEALVERSHSPRAAGDEGARR